MDIANEIILSLKKIQENNEVSASSIKGTLTFSQIHCISAIGDMEDANVTKLSNDLGMTTGAITKMCKKLFNERFVRKYQNEGNNKEVYYSLTESGQKIYEIHKQMHEKFHNNKMSIIAKYNEDEKVIILKFLNDINSLMDNTFTELSKNNNSFNK